MMSKVIKICLATVLAGSFALTGCSGDGLKISDNTKKHGIELICATQDALISQLGVGGAVTRTAAGIIADNAKDKKIVKIAKKVEKGNTDKKLIKELKNYVKKECR